MIFFAVSHFVSLAVSQRAKQNPIAPPLGWSNRGYAGPSTLVFRWIFRSFFNGATVTESDSIFGRPSPALPGTAGVRRSFRQLREVGRRPAMMSTDPISCAAGILYSFTIHKNKRYWFARQCFFRRFSATFSHVLPNFNISHDNNYLSEKLVDIVV